MFSFHLLLSWILEELLAFQRLWEFRFMLSWSLYYYLSKKETNHFNASDYRWLWSGALSCCSRIKSGSYYCKQQFASEQCFNSTQSSATKIKVVAIEALLLPLPAIPLVFNCKAIFHPCLLAQKLNQVMINQCHFTKALIL